MKKVTLAGFKRISKRLTKSFWLPPPPIKKKPKQIWSIGIYAGVSPFDLIPAPGVVNPVLTASAVSDVQAIFVADPFMLHVGNRWYMFFEVMNAVTRKGEIGLAISGDGRQWTYQQIVLAEPFHLSYPYIFQWENKYYMVPEAGQTRSIRLYEASNFPVEWSPVGTLLEGQLYLDASIFCSGSHWWMYVETNPESSYFDTLRFYFADSLLGPWREHPASPVVAGNGHLARPAG